MSSNPLRPATEDRARAMQLRSLRAALRTTLETAREGLQDTLARAIRLASDGNAPEAARADADELATDAAEALADIESRLTGEPRRPAGSILFAERD